MNHSEQQLQQMECHLGPAPPAAPSAPDTRDVQLPGVELRVGQVEEACRHAETQLVVVPRTWRLEIPRVLDGFCWVFWEWLISELVSIQLQT